MSPFLVRLLGDLGDALTLAPERHAAAGSVPGEGEPLSAFVAERTERMVGAELEGAVVFDTTHARSGVLDARAALRVTDPPASAKKRVFPGDLLVSRLRPYLRQVALVHAAVCAGCDGRKMACSTEFYVLSPRDRDGKRGTRASLAFLLPWLLGEAMQARLAAAQEGGHHPRVPREVLLSMRVDPSQVASRAGTSARVERALAAAYKASGELEAALREGRGGRG